MYEKKYHSIVHKNLLEDERYYLFRAKCSNRFYWKYLRGKVLDFGCGIGQNIFLHKEKSIGIEISEFALNECKKKGIEVRKNIEEMKDERFEGILCVHVLEHLRSPYNIVQNFYRILKDGGRLVIVLPYSKKNRPFRKFRSDIAKHFYNWNFGSINEILVDVGFTIKFNRFNYAYGYSKLYKLPFQIAIILLTIFGRLTGRKEMIIVAEK